jgi:glycopeptide antibiotics resistance protein
MALLPNPPGQLVPFEWDKANHVLAFMTLTILANLAYPRISWIWIGVSLSAFGASIELLQAIPALHRDPDAIDWLADILAVVGAIGFVALVRVFRRLLK